MKVRRTLISDRYEPFVRALYDQSKTARISVEVTFEDGRKGVIAGEVAVRDLSADTVVAAIGKAA